MVDEETLKDGDNDSDTDGLNHDIVEMVNKYSEFDVNMIAYGLGENAVRWLMTTKKYNEKDRDTILEKGDELLGRVLQDIADLYGSDDMGVFFAVVHLLKQSLNRILLYHHIEEYDMKDDDIESVKTMMALRSLSHLDVGGIVITGGTVDLTNIPAKVEELQQLLSRDNEPEE